MNEHADRDHSNPPTPNTDQAQLDPMQEGTSPFEAVREERPALEGMVDSLGRPATIYTPPEDVRRDPARWPTPTEFVAEWEQHSPEARLQLAERVLADGQVVAGGELERLRAEVDSMRRSEGAAARDLSNAFRRAGAAEARGAELEATLAEVRALMACASEGCPCGGDRAAIPTRELEAILDASQAPAPDPQANPKDPQGLEVASDSAAAKVARVEALAQRWHEEAEEIRFTDMHDRMSTASASGKLWAALADPAPEAPTGGAS